MLEALKAAAHADCIRVLGTASENNEYAQVRQLVSKFNFTSERLLKIVRQKL